MSALEIIGAIGLALIVGLVIGAVLAKRSSTAPTGAPTDPALAVEVASKIDTAGKQATAAAQAKADEVKHATVGDLLSRADELRARGRSGK